MLECLIFVIIGTGNPDMSKYEFLTNQHRDTYSSLVGHYDQLSYGAVALNESVGRMKLQFLDKMILPCGPPPPTKKPSTSTVID